MKSNSNRDPIGISKTIRAYVEEFLLYGEPLTSDSQSLVDDGVIDSMGMMETIAFLEEEFEITIPQEDILPKNLDSITNMTAFVSSQLNL